MLIALQILSTLIAVPAVLCCAYLLLLTLLSARVPVPPASSRSLRFSVVVPAHNEASGIARTVASLRAIDWPGDRFRVCVVADNCTDETATLAREAGAVVLVRTNAELRGKGYALAHAFDHGQSEGWTDAYIIVDADADVSPNLIEACAARIEQGESAVQVHYGIRNPFASWRTRLIAVAKGAFHIVRSRARERLGLSCGIRGNGWCVTADLLRRVPYQCYSLTEDVEYGLLLGLAGVRVAYADEAHSNADMVTSETIARKQRQRWEAGRMGLIRQFALSTLAQALRTGSKVRLDLAIDLMVLPLSYVVLNVLGLIVCGALIVYWGEGSSAWLVAGLVCLLALAVHVMRGWQVSGTGWRGLTALLHVPTFLVWKVIIMLGRKTTEWVRTDRETT